MTAYDIGEIERTTRANETRIEQAEARLALLEAFRDKEAVSVKDKDDSLQKWIDEINALLDERNQQHVAVLKLINRRLESLEHLDRSGVIGTTLKSQAAQQQAQPPANLYAPLRNDTKALLDLAAFVRRLLDPQDLGWAVNTEIRQLAREALGLHE